MTTLSDFDLQEGFCLANCLHPDRAVALCVLMDACEALRPLEDLVSRRYGYKLHTPLEGRLQFSIYLESLGWEKDQESEFPKKEPRYRPTADDGIIRYIKALALKSMDRSSRYGAVGIGCHLFRYEPHEISQLSEDVFTSDNIRRVKGNISKFLKERFAEANGFINGDGELPLEKPDDNQRRLIRTSLSLLAPWTTCPDALKSGYVPLLESYFSGWSQKSEWERLHVLFDLRCGGFPRLVNEYNSMFPKGNKMRLEDPETKLGCPKLAGAFGGPPNNGGEPHSDERFCPEPLTREEISTIRHSLEKNERRRKKYRWGTLRIVVDGRETTTLTPDWTNTPFTIPETAACIKVFGQDDEGELLLAVFPLTSLEEEHDYFDHQLLVDDGHRIELSTFLSKQSFKRCVWLRYSEAPNRLAEPAAHSPYRSPLISVLLHRAETSLYFKNEVLLGWADTGGVYVAEDQRKKTPVIITALQPSNHNNERAEILRASLQKAIKSLIRVRHRNVARLVEIGELLDARSYAVMESVPGINLRTQIDSGGMELSTFANLTRQIAAGVGELHKQSIIHGDLKPENILLQNVRGKAQVKLCDFGIVKDLSFEPAYSAPELLGGVPPSVQSDIYSFGVVAFEMVTGRLPFVADSTAALLESKFVGVWLDPCELRADLPGEMRDVIWRALLIDPRDRYTSVNDFGNAIARVLAKHRLTIQRRRLLRKNHLP